MYLPTAADEEGDKRDGDLTDSHVGALVSAVDAFLDASVGAARRHARAVFDDKMESFRNLLTMIPPSAPFEDVETLAR